MISKVESALGLDKISLKLMPGLSATILIIILIFGLRLKGFSFSNNVDWIKDQPGIRFRQYGIAFTKPSFQFVQKDISAPNGFSLEIAIKPASKYETGFNFIMALHSGKDRNQLLMGQWKSWIILMNGDDYDNKRKTKRIAVDTASTTPTARYITITSGESGTKVYFDGQLIRAKNDLILKIPNGGQTRLLIGNSVYGKHTWEGEVYGLSFYKYELTSHDAAHNFKEWSKRRHFSFAQKSKAILLYYFDEKKGERAIDHSGGNLHLEIPPKMQILEREILSPIWKDWKLKGAFIQDMIINLAGFIPLGFTLIATLMKLGGIFKKKSVLITFVLCFVVSLMIEIIQAWIPSRSSQMLDLVLNSIGALIGMIIFRFLQIFGQQAVKT